MWKVIKTDNRGKNNQIYQGEDEAQAKRLFEQVPISDNEVKQLLHNELTVATIPDDLPHPLDSEIEMKELDKNFVTAKRSSSAFGEKEVIIVEYFFNSTVNGSFRRDIFKGEYQDSSLLLKHWQGYQLPDKHSLQIVCTGGHGKFMQESTLLFPNDHTGNVVDIQKFQVSEDT